MLNLFLVLTNVTALGAGIEVEWAAVPASGGEPGSVSVGLSLPEDELLFVSAGSSVGASSGEMFASFEATASIDGELNTRSSGRKSRDGEPLEVTLEIDGVIPGTHELSVSLSDRESGQTWEWQGRIEVPLWTSSGWNSGALQITTGLTLRPDEDFHAYWDIFPPMDGGGAQPPVESDLRVAYAVRAPGGEVYREGWFSSSASQSPSGTRTAEVDIDLSGLEAGDYQLLAVALDGSGEIVTSAARGFTLLRAWDIWGNDPEETSSLIWPIARPSELSALRDGESMEERRAVMAEFWRERDPSPSTRRNEFLDLYLGRLDFVDERYSYLGRSGVTTDRGRVYLLLGEPDQVQDYPFETESVPYQVWTYYTPPALVVFVDSDGTGVYELYNDWQEVLGAVSI